MRLRIAHRNDLPLRSAGRGRDPGAAADAAQSRGPICRALAHRRVGRCAARRARGRVRQYHPCVLRRRAVRRTERRGRRRGRDAEHQRRRARHRRAIRAEPVPARHRADPGRCRRSANFAQSIRAAKGGEVLAELHALLDRLHEDMAHDADDAQGAGECGRGFCAQARPVARLEPYFHRRGAQRSAFRRAMSAAIIAATTDGATADRPRLGGGFRARSRLGRLRSRATASARPMPMCASPSGSMRSAPRRCAARAMAPGAETLAVAIKVGQ